MIFLDIPDGTTVKLPGRGSRPDQVHVFEDRVIRAVNASLAAQRPLLVRGEPGVGKSQLARAVARKLRRVYVHHVVDSRTESQDLLWHYDAVARLGEAQLQGALGETVRSARRKLDVRLFVRPGPLWWAFDWADAERHAREVGGGVPPQDEVPAEDGKPSPAHGCVMLIDEIDKAESDVPNGLLEALGAGEFTPLGRKHPVVATGEPPLVVITTNNERALPDAFVRRCMVLQLNLPDDPAKLKQFLVERGRKHFENTDLNVLKTAADQLIEDRTKAKEARQFPLPGQAEYLDLLRAVVELAKTPDDQEQLLNKLAEFTFHKHPEAGR